MPFTPQQDKAMLSICHWVRDPSAPQVYRVFGPAGVGKTFITRESVSEVTDVLYASYTGKAAHVMRQHGMDATTIHSLIYAPVGENTFRLDELIDQLNQEKDEFKKVSIKKQIKEERKKLGNPSFNLKDDSVDLIVKHSGGYPYFIQFICKEAYDVFLPKLEAGENVVVPLTEITRKLDTDFFAGRWARATDRQRALLVIIAQLENSEEEFSVQEIVELSKNNMEKPFSSSHVNQMLSSLSTVGLIYKNRFGKYSFAVPLLGQFIIRQQKI